jgi:hypothetical protein
VTMTILFTYLCLFEKIFSVRIFLMHAGRGRSRIPCWNVKSYIVSSVYSHTFYHSEIYDVNLGVNEHFIV